MSKQYEISEQRKRLLSDDETSSPPPYEGHDAPMAGPSVTIEAPNIRGDISHAGAFSNKLLGGILMAPIFAIVFGAFLLAELWAVISTLFVLVLASHDLHLLPLGWTMIEYGFMHLVFVFPGPKTIYKFTKTFIADQSPAAHTPLAYSRMMFGYSLHFFLAMVITLWWRWAFLTADAYPQLLAAVWEALVYALVGMFITAALGLKL